MVTRRVRHRSRDRGRPSQLQLLSFEPDSSEDLRASGATPTPTYWPALLFFAEDSIRTFVPTGDSELKEIDGP